MRTSTSGAGIALRGALGLALYAHACFLLGLAGQLRAWPLIALTAVFAGVFVRATRPHLAWLVLAPLLVLALYPPLAFDETLYHLPFVQAFARDGAIRFLPDLRFPVFPVLHEALCVPAFLLGGDVATHVVSLVQVALIAALLVEWDARAGRLAAALFLGSPLVVQLATTLHVDIALTLFAVAGLLALDRERYALAGFFLGSACGVKYLGFYFAVAALIVVIVRRRGVPRFALTCALTALPMTAWIWWHTGDPWFPFLKASAWSLASPSVVTLADRVLLLWNATFARGRVGMHPPVTPLLVPLVVVMIVAALRRDALARLVLLLGAAYVVAFNFLPQDVRYLVPLLPLVCLVGARFVVSRWPKAVPLVAILSIAPGIAYAGYRIARQGMPLVNRTEWLAQRVPEYRALQRAGTGRVYACRAEQLKALAGGDLLGDHNGPWSYERVLTGAGDTLTLAARMRRIGVRYYLAAKRHCPPPHANGGMELVYEDDAAQLWRVIGAPASPPAVPGGWAPLTAGEHNGR